MSPPLYRADIKSLEFVFAVTVGSIGSAALSWIHVGALISVLFALFVMGTLAFLRWRIARKVYDFQSLEAFAEDIYLLGYLLTLAALLGLAPRLMSDENNLFNIAGLKLITTVVGLALMMIFRQIARRWAEEKEGKEMEKFVQQQQAFSEAVARLNQGADELTSKVADVMQRFDPELLGPFSDWSNRAAAAFSAVVDSLEKAPVFIQASLQQMNELNNDLVQLKVATGTLTEILNTGASQATRVLASELKELRQIASGFGDSLAAIQPSSEVTRAALENLGTNASQGAAQISRTERALKKLADVEIKAIEFPMNRLADALESSAQKTDDQIGSLRGDLKAAVAATQELGGRIGVELSKPLLEHREVLEQMRVQLLKTSEQIAIVTDQLQRSLTPNRPNSMFETQLLAGISELHAEIVKMNTNIKSLPGRTDGAAAADHRPGILGRFFGGSSSANQ